MDTGQLSENVPPAKKLKQATLNFFKASPKVENPKESIKPKKRKNPSPAPVDSPNKTAKLSKPLVILTDPPNSPSKQSKAIKSSSLSEPIINDHEVSSSSEADSGSSKTSGGKCCLMERFVCKRPKETNHEISSTNDIDGKIRKDKSESTVSKGKKAEEDCIILYDEDIQDVKTESKTIENKVVPEDVKEKVKTSPHKDESLNGTNLVAESKHISREPEKQMNESAPESLLISGTEETVTPHKENTITDEALDVSVNESSFLSGTELASTPCKDTDTSVNNSAADSTPTATKTQTSKTPASKKKGPKVDLAKKAEKEAQKQKVKKEREQQRSEKKRKLEEEKAEKERQRKEKKEAKEKEKQLQQEKLQKEKEEKEKLKEIEKQKKEEEKKRKEEEKQQKEEEKKKKQAAQEAKLEEKKQKEDEKRQKEEEKKREEDEKKKKAEKAKQAFQSFFIKPKENAAKPAATKPSQGQFVPFQVKKDMHLAPATRRDALSGDTKLTVDQILENPEMSKTTYLNELKSGHAHPHKTGRVLRVNPEPSEDIEVVHDPEALKKVMHKVKLLQFHTDYRPPYYGTWRKTPTLSPRNPWKKDESMFDYEVDSDDEWEEEEPGESLSCSDGEEDKGEKGEEDENDDEEDGWMVPHGYLSEDEGCNEDDEITPEKLKLQQLAKAKAWEEEQKRKLQAAPLIAVGCFFEHSPSPLMSGDVRLLYEFRGVVISPSLPIPTSLFGCPEQDVEDPTTPDKSATTPSQRGCVKKAVPDEAMPDLIRLVHGNTSGIKRLIQEFRVYWFKKESADASVETTTPKGKLDKSMQETDGEVSFLDDSTQENPADAEGKQGKEMPSEQKADEGNKCSISKRQLDIKINAIAVREKRQTLKVCWYVHEAILKEFDLEGLVCNSLLQPEPPVAVESSKELAPTPVVNDQRSIMDFALSREECAKKEALLPKPAENPPKLPQNEQKSLMDFVKSREELAKQGATTPKSENLPKPVMQNMSKDSKKACGQMSIMDFAKSDQVKSKVAKAKVESQPIPMETDDDTDVILIESPSDVSKTSASHTCDEKFVSKANLPCSSNVSSSSNASTCDFTSSKIIPPSPSSVQNALTTPITPQSAGNQSSSKHHVSERKELLKLQSCFVKLEKFQYNDK